MDTTILKIFRRHPLTRRFSAEERTYLVSLGRVIGYLPGAYIFHESQPRRAFGIVLKRRGRSGRNSTRSG